MAKSIEYWEKINGGAKLKDVDVINIRKSLGTNKEVAAEFGVHFSTISAIRNRKCWAHI